MEKVISNMTQFLDASLEEREAILVETVKARCDRLKLRVTLWLLFDTAAALNPFTRDTMLTAFKKYARLHHKPRSVAEGAKWLALNLKLYRK